MIRLILLLSLSISSVFATEVYRSVDEDGNVIFSDTPSSDSERIEIREPVTIQPPTETFEYEPQIKKVEDYKRVEISSPADDTAIRDNQGNVSITVAIEPGLNTGDVLVLYFDGKEYASGQATSFSMSNLDRGTHQLRAVIKSRDGRILKSSATTSFHILRHSIQHPKPKR